MKDRQAVCSSMTATCVDSSPEHVTKCHVQLTGKCNLIIPHQHSLTTVWTHLTWQLHNITTRTSYCNTLKHYLQHVSTFSESECYNHQALFPCTAHQTVSFSFCCNSYQYTQSNKNPSAWYFVRPALSVTCGTVAITIRVIFLSPYLCIRGVSPSSIHYNQSHHIYINRRQQYICLMWN